MRLCFALLVLATAAAAAPRPYTSWPASRRTPRSVQRGRPGAAAVKPAAPGSQVAVKPASSSPADLSLVGKPCVYTPAVIAPLIYDDDEGKFLKASPISACTDPRLSAAQQSTCAKCIGIKSRAACLAAVSNTYFGVDEHSCTWVGSQSSSGSIGRKGDSAASAVKTKEVRHSLGISVPWSHGMWLDNATCSVSVRFEIVNPMSQKLFPTGMFINTLRGWRSDGSAVPFDLGSSFTCTLRKGRQVCEGTIPRPTYLTKGWLSIEQEIWVEDQNAINELRKSSSICTQFTGGICTALPAPYKYDYILSIVEQPCKPPVRPAAPAPKASHYSEMPFAETVPIMYPGGSLLDALRDLRWSLGGTRGVEWSMRVLPCQSKAPTVPLFVAVIGQGELANACDWSPDMFVTCDYSALASKALPGSACYARECKGRLVYSKPAPADLVFVVAYQRFSFDALLDPGKVVNTTETPAQTVVLNLAITP